MRPFVAIVLSVVIGMIAVMAFTRGVLLIYPQPEQFNEDGQRIPLEGDALANYIATLPLPAFLLTLAAHQGGALVGGAALIVFAKQRWMGGALIVGLIFLAAGIANLVMMPAHPLWFAAADVLLYVPMALLGGWIACRLLPEPPAYSMDDLPPHLRRRARN